MPNGTDLTQFDHDQLIAFLIALRDGEKLPPCSLKQNNARCRAKRHGFAVFEQGKWHLLPDGLKFLSQRLLTK